MHWTADQRLKTIHLLCHIKKIDGTVTKRLKKAMHNFTDLINDFSHEEQLGLYKMFLSGMAVWYYTETYHWNWLTRLRRLCDWPASRLNDPEQMADPISSCKEMPH